MMKEDYRIAAPGSNPGAAVPGKAGTTGSGLHGSMAKLGRLFSHAAATAAVLLIVMAYSSALLQLGV